MKLFADANSKKNREQFFTSLGFANSRVVSAGIAHAGWRGVAKNIAGRMVSILQNEYGCDPGTIRAEVGPHI